MNRGPFIFLGVFIILSLSWAMVINRSIQETGHLSPAFDAEQGGRLPSGVNGAAAQGKLVYQEMGCIACHTQQVRVASGFDLQRGWGERQSVARDYIDQSPVLIGNTRLGPDLTVAFAAPLQPADHFEGFQYARFSVSFRDEENRRRSDQSRFDFA
jgi:cytochrome c oxidase cbb3-type subunit II